MRIMVELKDEIYRTYKKICQGKDIKMSEPIRRFIENFVKVETNNDER
jgi:hypothetical protein